MPSTALVRASAATSRTKGCARRRGFHAVEIDADAAYLDLPVLAADPLQQPVGPLAHEVSRSKESGSMRAARLQRSRPHDVHRSNVPTTRMGLRR